VTAQKFILRRQGFAFEVQKVDEQRGFFGFFDGKKCLKKIRPFLRGHLAGKNLLAEQLR